MCSLYVILGLERTHDTLKRTGRRWCLKVVSQLGKPMWFKTSRGVSYRKVSKRLGLRSSGVSEVTALPLNAIGSICLYVYLYTPTRAHTNTFTPTHSSQTALLWGSSNLAAVMICPIKSAS